MNFLDEAWDVLKIPFAILLFCILLQMFVMGKYEVAGHSMEPNFKDGEKLVSLKTSYQTGEIKRFDVVVFPYKNTYYTKRIIGLPGDHIRVKNDVLYINGIPKKEPFLPDEFKKRYKSKDFDTYTPSFDLEELYPDNKTVPKDTVFVLGDNRPFSHDSRYKDVGFIPVDMLQKVAFHY